jgi:hypothetical protein
VLAGASVAWAADALDRRPSSARLVATCALLAALPDVDLLLPGYHRSFTHSVTAVAIVFIVAAVVTGKVNYRRRRVAIVCALAYATHLLFDWLGADTLPPLGLQAFWPFNDQFFVSGWDVFTQTERRNPFSGPTIAQNLRTAAREIAIVAPVAGALWLVRVKALARLPAEVARRNHAPQ